MPTQEDILLAEREKKLPQWAKETLMNLRAQLRSARGELDALIKGKAPSSFWMESFDRNGARRHYLPEHANIVFGDPNKISGFYGIRLWKYDGMLSITGSRAIIVKPTASNRILVGEED